MSCIIWIICIIYYIFISYILYAMYYSLYIIYYIMYAVCPLAVPWRLCLRGSNGFGYYTCTLVFFGPACKIKDPSVILHLAVAGLYCFNMFAKIMEMTRACVLTVVFGRCELQVHKHLSGCSKWMQKRTGRRMWWSMQSRKQSRMR